MGGNIRFKKLRGDSSFVRLTAEQRAEVDDLLLAGANYVDVQAFMAEAGVRCSQTSISEYYQNHIVPLKIRRMRKVADGMAELDTDGLDEATLAQVRALALDTALTPGANPKQIRMLFELVLKARSLDLENRRVALLEKKAAQLDEARAALEERKAAGGLTPEALAEIENMLKLM